MPRKSDTLVQCWCGANSGYRCEATIPDTNFETMTAHGWGFMFAFDPTMPNGVPGAYYACPEHKDSHS